MRSKGDMATKSTGELNLSRPVTAIGLSMRPFIPSGATILQSPVLPEEICLGDIITFSPQPGVSFTHRVVRVLEEKNQISFLTKGDSGLNVDAWIREDQLIARVTHVNQTNIRSFAWRVFGRGIAFCSYGEYCVRRMLAQSSLNRWRHRFEQRGLFPKLRAAFWFSKIVSPVGWLEGLAWLRKPKRTHPRGSSS